MYTVKDSITKKTRQFNELDNAREYAQEKAAKTGNPHVINGPNTFEFIRNQKNEKKV